MGENMQNTIQAELLNGNKMVALKRSIDYALSLPYHIEMVPIVSQMANVLSNVDPISPDELITEFLQRAKGHLESILIKDNVEVLRAEQIRKQYKMGSFEFKTSSFILTTGSLTGVVGQNGNGKTTLLRMLSGDLLPDGGEINYPLLPLNNKDPYAIKEHIGFIQQRIPRWYGLLEDNLKFTLATRGFKEEEILFRVEIMLKRLGLYQFRKHTWAQISGGYRTRFELARVLLTRPKILVLDEPLANLDVKAQQTFLQDLKHMAKTDLNPIAVILSSQLLHEVEQVSDELIFIKEGQCHFQSMTENSNVDSIIIEFISDTPYAEIIQLAKGMQADIKTENNLYTLTASTQNTSKTILQTLVSNDIELQYFRDITNSTKRLF